MCHFVKNVDGALTWAHTKFQARRFAAMTVAIVVVTGGILAFVIGGVAEPAYRWLWEETTGTPYTHIMRDRPWLLGAPAAIVFAILLIGPPLVFRFRLLVMWLTVGLGIVVGHVFW